MQNKLFIMKADGFGLSQDKNVFLNQIDNLLIKNYL